MTVERVDAVKVLGCNVMAGRHADGSIEVRLWSTQPVNPTTASEEVDPRLVGGE
jgi:hypothetical protein